ncbi:hypothetical protein [Nocardia sp. NPDC059229]|uniref:hypothetical protein n=1 Tax=Nocardia sp. NPDC059229 TaxID=3346778 RepID=UPI003698A2D6
MIVIIGLVILIAAMLIGLAGVLANGGSTHALTDHFAVFGYHVTGSTGLLFLYGIVVGGVGLAGLLILLAGARRTARRGAGARRELAASRRELAASRQDTPAGDPRPSGPIAPITPQPANPTHYTYTGTTDAAFDEPGNAAGQGVGGPPGHHPGRPAGPAPSELPRGGRRR